MRAGELADGGLGTFAAVDWCSAAKTNPSRLPVRSRSIESRTWNRDSPAHAWWLAGGSGAAGDGPGQQRHPRYAHERGEDADLTRQPERGGTRPREFAARRSLMTALDECYSGSPCPHFSSSTRSPSGPRRRRSPQPRPVRERPTPHAVNPHHRDVPPWGVAPRSGHSALLATMIKPSWRKHRVGDMRGLQRSDHRLSVTVCHNHLPTAKP